MSEIKISEKNSIPNGKVKYTGCSSNFNGGGRYGRCTECTSGCSVKKHKDIYIKDGYTYAESGCLFSVTNNDSFILLGKKFEAHKARLNDLHL